jgi:hypothetical protein
MGTLTYPITLDYRANWGLWEAYRECILQEYLDLFEGNFTIQRDNGLLVVEGRGPTLDIPDLLLGHSNKEAQHRGQFGEGTKIGWLVFVREGIHFTLHSGDRIYTARKSTKYNQPVMKVEWEEAEHFPGARYEIDWPEGEPLYEDRVVRPGDPRILYTDVFGRSILQEGGEPNIYVKGLWICKSRPWANNSAFSYDLRDVKLSEDRNIAETWTILQEVGRIWASVTDHSLLTQFYQAVKDTLAEKHANMYGGLQDKRAHAKAFKEIFGSRAVLQTDEELTGEAEYRGAESVLLPNSLREALMGAVETDREYIQELEGSAQVFVPDKKLDADELKVLRMIRRLAAKINSKLKVKAYLFATENKGASIQGNVMRISRSRLADPKEALASLIHELGHNQFGTQDATAEMVQAVCQMGSQLLLPYVWRG